jgi:hypothetical protein
MAVLKEIGVLSFAKMVALIDLVVGLIAAIFIFLFSNAFAAAFVAQASGPLSINGAILVIVPIVALVVGFVIAALQAWIYNMLAKKFGGIKINLKKNKLLGINVLSAAKFAAYGGVIVGFIGGLIALVISIGSGGGIVGGIVALIALTILFPIIFFLVVAICAIIYNFAAAHVGPIILNFKGTELKSVGVISYAKIDGIIGAIFGFFEGIFFAIRAAATPASAVPLLAQSLGIWSIVLFPILYFVLEFFSAGLQAVLYNYFASVIGGVRLKIS